MVVGRKTILIVLMTSTLLTIIGIGGMAGGATILSKAPIPEMTDIVEDNPPKSFAEAVALQLASVHLQNSYRRPMAAIGFIISTTILIGSFMLTWRAKLAPWWITQTMIAKVIWVASNTLILVSQVQRSIAFPTEALKPYITKEFESFDWVSMMSLWLIFTGALSIALHAAVGWRINRPDIVEFIHSKPPIR